MTLNPGDLLETAIWLSGEETTEDLSRFSTDAQDALNAAAENEKVVIGPPNAVTKYPGQKRVPPVPDHVSGPDVRLLVVEAKVVGHVPQFGKGPSRFTDDLERDDLRRLRAITRRAYERHMPGQPRLTNRQCDTIINDLGPEAAADALRQDSVKLDRVLH